MISAILVTISGFLVGLWLLVNFFKIDQFGDGRFKILTLAILLLIAAGVWR